MISFDACLSFSIIDRQQGETVGKRLNCFMGVIMFVFSDDHIPRKWLFDEMCSCTTAWPLYTQTTHYNQPLIFLFSVHCWATPAGSEDAAFQEVPLRFQLINKLIFYLQGHSSNVQATFLFLKRERMMKNECNIFVISKLSEEASSRSRMEAGLLNAVLNMEAMTND